MCLNHFLFCRPCHQLGPRQLTQLLPSAMRTGRRSECKTHADTQMLMHTHLPNHLATPSSCRDLSIRSKARPRAHKEAKEKVIGIGNSGNWADQTALLVLSQWIGNNCLVYACVHVCMSHGPTYALCSTPALPPPHPHPTPSVLSPLSPTSFISASLQGHTASVTMSNTSKT